LKALRKHFGSPDGDVAAWPAEKRRAYAFAYRTAAFEYNMQNKPDEAWRYLEQAGVIWPDIFTRLDTFYELACGNQPRGQRGQVEKLEIDRNGQDLIRQLDQLFAPARPDLAPLRPAAYGNAYLALAMLSDQACHWAAGRHYLRQAIKANPRLASSPAILRRYAKLLLGRHSRGLKAALLLSDTEIQPSNG
jgi:tetratricopeptide (TPR) repeat protein